MSVQDLTNTTWVIPYSGLSDFWIENTFSINFSSSYYSDNYTGFGGRDSEVIYYFKNGQVEESPWDIGAMEMIPQDTIIITGGAHVTDTTLISWLEANATQQIPSSTITVDLTSLSGWSNVSFGQHTLTVKAKAQGYRDSELSSPVTFTRAPQGNTFTITWEGRNYDSNGQAWAYLTLSRIPVDYSDYDYMLEIPYAGSDGYIYDKDGTAIENLGYGGSYTQVIDNVTSYTLWGEYNTDWGQGPTYIGVNGVLLPEFANKQTVNISVPTSITVQYDYDM